MARLLFALLFIGGVLGLSCGGSDESVEMPFTIGDDVELPIVVEGEEPRTLSFDPATGEVAELPIEFSYRIPLAKPAPDGTAIMIELDETLLLAGLDGTERELPRSAVGTRFTDWSSDGERLLFAGGEGLKELRIEDERVRVLHEGRVQDAVWSPDETKIAFIEDQLLSVLDLATNEIEVIAPEQTAIYLPNQFGDGHLAWSPDGTQIAFADWRIEEPVTQGQSDVYVVDANGENLRPLTDSPRAKRYFAWSPDGTYLAFSHNLSGGRHLRIVDVNAGRLLDVDVQTFSVPQWVGPGELLVNNYDGIVLVRIEGSVQALLTTSETCRLDLLGWAGDLVLFTHSCPVGPRGR